MPPETLGQHGHGGVVARTSFHADHQRVIGIAAFGSIKNDYDDYLGTGEPLQTNDNLKSVAGRYLYRIGGDWFIGAQGNAANYQVLGATPRTTSCSTRWACADSSRPRSGLLRCTIPATASTCRQAAGTPTSTTFAYREALGGETSFDAYRADTRIFVQHGGRHVLALRQYNWLTHDAPAGAQATVTLRGYKFGQYLAPYMSSFEAEERLLFGRRWGANLFAGVAGLYGTSNTPLDRHAYPMFASDSN